MIFRAVEDADLIRKARRGDVEAYNLLISRWEKRVYNYLLRIVANREDALDLSQDVFLKAYQNLRKLDDPGRFAPWLYRIALHEALNHRRWWSRHGKREVTIEGEEPGRCEEQQFGIGESLVMTGGLAGTTLTSSKPR